MNKTLRLFGRRASKALILLATCFSLQAGAESVLDDIHPTVNLQLQTRVDFARVDSLGAHDSNSGFHGRYLNLNLSGEIMPGLTYALRERLNKLGETASDVFAATDWVWLRYEISPRWALSAGKQIVLIGGYEYDANPINEYFTSRFWNNIACFQFGASASWTPRAGHTLSAQVTNSPYVVSGNSCYAYNLFWAGDMGPLQTLWSVNMVEYAPGRFVNYIALGNRLTLDKFGLDLDLMNRYTEHHRFVCGDYSVIAKASYAVKSWLTLMVKGGYDEFKINPEGSQHVDNPFFGGGIEIFPAKGSRELRFHAVWDRVSDNDGQRMNEINVGLTWMIDLCKSSR